VNLPLQSSFFPSLFPNKNYLEINLYTVRIKGVFSSSLINILPYLNIIIFCTLFILKLFNLGCDLNISSLDDEISYVTEFTSNTDPSSAGNNQSGPDSSSSGGSPNNDPSTPVSAATSASGSNDEGDNSEDQASGSGSEAGDNSDASDGSMSVAGGGVGGEAEGGAGGGAGVARDVCTCRDYSDPNPCSHPVYQRYMNTSTEDTSPTCCRCDLPNPEDQCDVCECKFHNRC
jgi:hypothetical protein